MCEVTCPYCYATLFDSELSAGQCTSCMRGLTKKWLHKTLHDWNGRGLQEGGAGWETVRGGLSSLAISLFLLAGVSLLGGGAVFLCEKLGRQAEILAFAVGLAVMLAVLMSAIGFFCSLFAPARAAVRNLAMFTCIDLFLTFFLLFFSVFFQRFEYCLGAAAAISAAIVIYFFYLRAIARYFRALLTGAALLTYAIASSILVILNIGALSLYEMNLPPLARAEMDQFIECGFVVQAIALMIWAGILLWKLRELVPLPRPQQGRPPASQ